MFKLNRDVLYLIFEELRDDRSTLYSCLSVNKIFCEIIIPILWKNPWKFLINKKKDVLLKVFISHLSGESRNYLSQRFNFWKTYIKDLYSITLAFVDI